MSEIQKFLFDGVPVRGAIVRLDSAWVEILRRRNSNVHTGAYPTPVQNLLGKMLVAGVLMQSGIKFQGSLALQIQGDGPLKLAVAEVNSDLSVRATASVVGAVDGSTDFETLVNQCAQGRCAVTLDPDKCSAGQVLYQGIVPLVDEHGLRVQSLEQALEHYMRQSEQIETALVLAADNTVAAGLLVQRMPLQERGSLAGKDTVSGTGKQPVEGDYERIATLARSLQADELLSLSTDTILHRLFWQEKLLCFAPQSPADVQMPHFACTCSRERVAQMLRGLGKQEVDTIIAEQGAAEIACEFCGAQYEFDAVDAAQLFLGSGVAAVGPDAVQ